MSSVESPQDIEFGGCWGVARNTEQGSFSED